ncbi:hypothetical protein FHG87_017116 [Trinorchestia longiramus]|nr:hypothetical protein FHG87_017116 [Trinorchestia longiramus]
MLQWLQAYLVDRPFKVFMEVLVSVSVPVLVLRISSSQFWSSILASISALILIVFNNKSASYETDRITIPEELSLNDDNEEIAVLQRLISGAPIKVKQEEEELRTSGMQEKANWFTREMKDEQMTRKILNKKRHRMHKMNGSCAKDGKESYVGPK